MNKLQIIILGAILICFSSCQFSENIYINEDGSGKMEFSFDGSEFMKIAGQAGQGLSDDLGEEIIDSLIVFKDFLNEKKDSIATLSKEKRDELKSLENFKMHMLMNPETNAMKFELITDFDNVNELQDMFEMLSKTAALQNKGEANTTTSNNNPLSSFGNDKTTDLKYTYKNNVFKRRVKVTDKDALKKVTDSLGEAVFMFRSSKYKLNYHFPKRIKSVSNEAALFSNDRKSFVLELGFIEYLTNPEALNLEVILED